MMDRIYMDNAATTGTDARVLEKMLPYFTAVYGNASSIHSFGREARKAVENARRQVAAAIGANPNEIYFTAGGSESDNFALKGAFDSRKGKGFHLITSAVEHHAILHTAEYLEKRGARVTYLPVDEFGRVSVGDVKNAIADDTRLISVMLANNEVGTLEPVKEIGKLTKERGILFHTDAVQAIGAVPVDVNEIGCDMLSLSGHKFHGPKGVGAIYIRSGVRLENLIHGGAQERGKRAGTENVPAIVGLGEAITLAVSEMPEISARIAKMRDRLIGEILRNIPETRLNGHPTERLPGNVNISFEGIEGEALLLSLDLQGIAGSSGSACTSGSLDPSHVLLAMGLRHETAHGSLRLSLGRDNTEEEVTKVLAALDVIVKRLRAMSPIWNCRRA
ncbi:MAG: cysteine desulfurase NifS [Eubacteriales bacterium]|nr:cysteine desulfurase NifS [Eubacteriales bacterium]MDD3881220.1 cysteine desulfurase NifS [Eubacteriales bacterium]MDD4512138.1 cysteine desulfurase NifS [Eubacteriales bacterium]